MSEYQTWREYLIEKLTADYERAIDYLDVVLEEYQIDRDARLFFVALRTVIESQIGISEVAKKIGIAPQVLSEMLSGAEAPRIDNLNTLLHALGCCLSIQALENTDQTVESGTTKILAPPSDDAGIRLDRAPDSTG